MEALGINLGYLIVQILNFVVIFLVLRAWVYKPLLGQLAKRREAVAKGLEDARVASDARSNAEKEADKIVTEAQVKATEIIREATEKAESVGDKIRAEAEAANEKVRQEVYADMEQERNRVLSEVRGQVVSLAIAAAQQLIGESLLQDKDRQHKLLDEFFSGVKDGKVVLLEDVDLTGKKVEIVSALPLTDEEKAAIKADFLAGASGEVEFAYKVDPSILGGLIIRAGDQIVDGSVVNQLQDLGKSLQ